MSSLKYAMIVINGNEESWLNYVPELKDKDIPKLIDAVDALNFSQSSEVQYNLVICDSMEEVITCLNSFVEINPNCSIVESNHGKSQYARMIKLYYEDVIDNIDTCLDYDQVKKIDWLLKKIRKGFNVEFSKNETKFLLEIDE